MSAPSLVEARKPMAGRAWLGGCLRGFAFVAAVLAPPLAMAQATSLAELSASALELSLQARQAAPDRGTVVLLGSKLEGAVLRDIRVQIDDGAPITYQFSEDEAHALNDGALYYLRSIVPEQAGSHRLRAEFRARADTGKPHATLITAQLDRAFDTGATPATLVLDVQAGGFVSQASLTLDTFAGSDALPAQAQFLLAGGRPFAAAVLFEASSSSDPVQLQHARAALGLQADAHDPLPSLRQYNAALAAPAAHRNDAQGASLQQLAQADAQGQQALAARDLANLTLGYRALQAGNLDVAEESFKRIRSPGPYSNAAMLGLGWTFLVPPSDQGGMLPVSLHPGSADEIAATRRTTPFRYLQAVVDGKRADDLRRALIPWSELVGRDPLDAAVQEGMLVIPYALDHLGAHVEAQEYYQRAAERLDAARQTLAAARQDVDAGRVFAELDARDADRSSGWPRLLVERHGDDAAVPLRVLMEDPKVAASLHDYRQLQEIDRALAADRLRLGDDASALGGRIDALRSRIATARLSAMAVASAAMDAELQDRDRQAGRYLAEAEFALARIDDRLPHGVDAP